MGSIVLLFGWNLPLADREKVSAGHFDEFVKYLSGLQRDGAIQGFDIVFLDPRGGDLNGFFLIKGESSQLDGVRSTSEWITHSTRASLHLEGSGVIGEVTGDEVMKRMAIWTNSIPS